MIVSLPPLDLKTIRCAEVSAEMSIVSSPASPSMVMVLRRRLVPEKSPMILKVSPPAAPLVPDGSTPLMRISSISVEFGDDRWQRWSPLRVIDDLGGGVEAARLPQRDRTPPRCRCGRSPPSIAGDDEGVAGGAFGSAIDHVTAIGRSRRIGVPDDGVVAGTAIDGVDAGVESPACDVTAKLSTEDVSSPVVSVASCRETDGGTGADLVGREGDVESCRHCVVLRACRR